MAPTASLLYCYNSRSIVFSLFILVNNIYLDLLRLLLLDWRLLMIIRRKRKSLHSAKISWLSLSESIIRRIHLLSHRNTLKLWLRVHIRWIRRNSLQRDLIVHPRIILRLILIYTSSDTLNWRLSIAHLGIMLNNWSSLRSN